MELLPFTAKKALLSDSIFQMMIFVSNSNKVEKVAVAHSSSVIPKKCCIL